MVIDEKNDDSGIYVFFKDIWMTQEGSYIKIVHVQGTVVYGVLLSKEYAELHMGRHVIEGEIYYAHILLEAYNLEDLVIRILDE